MAEEPLTETNNLYELSPAILLPVTVLKDADKFNLSASKSKTPKLG